MWLYLTAPSVEGGALNYSELIQRFRARTNLKQDAVAELLGVSQSTISRIESGSLHPKAALRERLDRFLAEPANQSLFSRCRAVVRASPVVSFLLGVRGGEIVLDAASRPALALGRPWSEQSVCAPLRGVLGDDAADYLRQLVQLGSFRGEVACIEVLWRYTLEAEPVNWLIVFVPVRDDLGDWFLHATAVRMTGAEAARLEASWGGVFKVVYPQGITLTG